MHILVINSGSSSIKFSIFEAARLRLGREGRLAARLIRRRDQRDGRSAKLGFTFRDAEGRELSGSRENRCSRRSNRPAGGCGVRPGMPPIDAVGYRVVHPGALLDRHQRITEEVLKDLEQAVAFAPLHDPAGDPLDPRHDGRFPQARHYACFDTVFHQTMPAEASTYAIPSEYRGQGVRRYGFHGLSCEGVVDDMRAASDRADKPVSPAHGDCPPGQRVQRDRTGGRAIGR